MTSLRASQELFLRCVRFDPAPAELDEVFAPSPRLSARECMAIYRNMYWYRLVDALFDVFPRLAERLGNERFTHLACGYLATSPARAPELERVGHGLSGYIQTSLSSPDRELLAELARLEYAALEVLLAPDGPKAVSVTEIDAAELPFQSATLWPALAIERVQARALAHFEGRPAPPDGEERVEVVLWRRRFAVRHRVIQRDESTALAAARAGRPVEEICIAFESPERASEVLRGWFADSLIVALSRSS